MKENEEWKEKNGVQMLFTDLYCFGYCIVKSVNDKLVLLVHKGSKMNSLNFES